MAQVSGIQVRFTGDTTGLEQAVNRAENSLGVFSRAANDAVPGAFASKLQNASYQIQDFASQVGSGTSAVRAAGQQLPQLLSGFGTLGVVMGTVAAIAVPLAANFLTSADAMARMGDTIQTIAPYAAVATAALAGFYAPSLLAGIGATSGAIGVGLVGAIKAVTAAMMANPLGLLVAGVSAAAVAIFAFRDDIKNAIGVDIPAIIKDAVNFTIRGFMNLKDVVAIAYENLGDIVGAALVGVSNVALRAITGLINKVVAGINLAIDAVNSLADYTGITLTRFQEMDAFQFENVFAEGAANAGKKIGQAMAENAATDYVGTMASLASDAMSQVSSYFSGGAATDAAATGKAKGGGGQERASDNPSQEPGNYFTDRLQRIQDEFKTERELLAEEYALNQQVLDNALANKMIKEEEYRRLTEQLEQQHQDKLKGIRLSAIQENLGYASDFMGSMAQIAELGGKKTTKIAKAFGIAQALISTFQGAAKALTLPFPANLAAYASVLAQGLSAVASIRKVNENGSSNGAVGGAGGGSLSASGGGGGAGGGGGSGPTTTFQFTLMNDPMGFGEKFARQFIDQLNSTQRNGGQIRGVIA